MMLNMSFSYADRWNIESSSEGQTEFLVVNFHLKDLSDRVLSRTRMKMEYHLIEVKIHLDKAICLLIY